MGIKWLGNIINNKISLQNRTETKCDSLRFSYMKHVTSPFNKKQKNLNRKRMLAITSSLYARNSKYKYLYFFHLKQKHAEYLIIEKMGSNVSIIFIRFSFHLHSFKLLKGATSYCVKPLKVVTHWEKLKLLRWL